jgi:hypothetical protein
MSRQLSIMRWIGALAVAITIYVIAMFLCTLIWSSLGLGVGPQFYFLFFISCFLAVAVGVLIVPPEQRKNAALALWILSAIDAFLWPTLSGHLTLANLYPIGVEIAGGGIAYLLARSGLLSGRGSIAFPHRTFKKGPVPDFETAQIKEAAN